jgi:hypothetical protein
MVNVVVAAVAALGAVALVTVTVRALVERPPTVIGTGSRLLVERGHTRPA